MRTGIVIVALLVASMGLGDVGAKCRSNMTPLKLGGHRYSHWGASPLRGLGPPDFLMTYGS